MHEMQVIRAVIIGVLMLVLAACETVRPGEAKIPEGAVVTHRAAIIGSSYRETTGTISVYQSASRPVIVFEPNFRSPEGDQAVVALGLDGYRSETALGPLLKPEGRQAYSVPGHIPIERFNEVWLWHRDKDIPLGIARLTPI
ncbi:MAG: hypothetical protein AAF409_19445 [Pseudomonadota bacterium]